MTLHRHGNAEKARKSITSLANLYSGCRILMGSCDEFVLGEWSEPEKKGWRLKQAALLHAELDEIAALTGRTADTECCICLEPLAGDADAESVHVIPTCYHRLHTECAKEQLRSQQRGSGLLGMFGPNNSNLKCPSCRT